MRYKEFNAIGTKFKVTLWDGISSARFDQLMESIIEITLEFDATYSRFKSDSLVTKLSKLMGVVEVPDHLVNMLLLYESLNKSTKGKINPAIGLALSDSGYDSTYSLKEKKVIRDIPLMEKSIRIVDKNHIALEEEILLDLGALGKGYLVDIIFDFLRREEIDRFLVDGSGDIRYFSAENEPIICGLEHPLDASMAIGTLSIVSGSLCASATNRRKWGNRNHYIDPHSSESPTEIIATWVYADNAALADGLSSALFFAAPEDLSLFQFEYLLINKEVKLKKSRGFNARLFGHE